MALQPPSFPWHEGEVALQRRLGVAERMSEIGSRVVRDYMPDQHRDFFAQLPCVVIGAVDPAGDAWASIAVGHPGFLASPDPRSLEISMPRDPRDPADAGLEDGDAIGLLGIELHSRRRNRMNGHVLRKHAGTFAVRVEHSFGNCPRYIQRRDFEFVGDPAQPSTAQAEAFTELNGRLRDIIAKADTFFVASYADGPTGRQVDVSHRGGRPGFVRVAADGLLTIPDFSGNLHFNTLGNFVVNPHAGLLFVDFETGDLVQLTGTPELVLESPEIDAFEGAERLWTFRTRRAILRQGALALRWVMREEGWSPNTLKTGIW